MPSKLENRVAQLELELKNSRIVTIPEPVTPIIETGLRDYLNFGSFILDRKNGILERVTELTSDYTQKTNDRYLLANQSSGTLTVTLVESEIGKVITVKALTANQVDVTSADNIDGAGTVSLTSQYEWTTIVYDGTTWHQV